MSEPEVIELRRYPSRKLYNKNSSSYVRLPEVAEMVRKGANIRVEDTETGEDVTRQVLAQIILEGERQGKSLLSADLFHDVIRRGEKFWPRSAQRISTAASTASRFCIGSPIPISTMLKRWPSSSAASAASCETGTAARQQAHHPVTRHEAFDSRADRQDFPGILHAGDIVGRFRPGLRIPAHALQDVRAVQRRRPDADEQVVRARDRIGHVLELQDLGATGPGYHYCFHSSWSFASRV